MANINSTPYAAQLPGASGGAPLYPQAKQVNGKVRYASIETTIASLGATNDTFSLIRLKAGARVVPGLSKIICESPGTTVTGSIGDAASSARYMAAKALGGSAQDVFWSSTPAPAAYVGADITAGNEVIVWTSTNIGTPTPAAKIVFLIAYLDE